MNKNDLKNLINEVISEAKDKKKKDEPTKKAEPVKKDEPIKKTPSVKKEEPVKKHSETGVENKEESREVSLAKKIPVALNKMFPMTDKEKKEHAKITRYAKSLVKMHKSVTEVSTTDGSSMPPSKFFVGKVSDKTKKAGGMIPVGKSLMVKRSLKENEDLDVKQQYDIFVSSLKNQEFKLEKQVEVQLKQKLLNKKVKVHGSKGYKQFKKDYEFVVINVKLDDYYGNYEVILVGDDNKEYFVDRAYKIKILSVSEPPTVPSTPTTPAGTNPVTPTTPATEPKADISKEIEK